MTGLYVAGGLSVAALGVSLGIVFEGELSWWVGELRRRRRAAARKGRIT